jgi:predicted O-methyltransferase YrrM
MLTALGKKYSTDKATYHGFTDFYHEILAERRTSIESVLEFGILNGGSLRMWRNYFPYSTTLCAIDINLKGHPLTANTFCTYGNQDSIPSLEDAMKNLPVKLFDLIIEDGGHTSVQQRNSLQVAWPRLKSGGIYILEDLHTGVPDWAEYKKYQNESPTLFEDIMQYLQAKPSNLPVDRSTIQRIVLWTQPSTTSMTCIFYKA